MESGLGPKLVGRGCGCVGIVNWDCAKFISKSDLSSKPLSSRGVGIGSRSGIGGLGWGWDHGKSLSREVITGVEFDVWNPHYINRRYRFRLRH